MVHVVRCGSCGASLDEDAACLERNPCPRCGSTLRYTHVVIEDTVCCHEKIGLKVREQGVKRPIREVTTGDDLTRSTGQWNHLEREVDRKKDSYHEIVTDPRTGQVLHEVDESLSAHQGHGDARGKGKAPRDG